MVVESPAKARTVNRFLGGDYKVLASMGHVRDLPEHRLGVNVEQDFRPFYEAPKDKRGVIASIKAAGDRAERIYLATDPDREGEAIAWHVLEAAGWRDKPVSRVVFHSITEDAIREAFEHERDIDMELVNAQQARRIEDRLVGFKLSPLLRPLVGQEINPSRKEQRVGGAGDRRADALCGPSAVGRPAAGRRAGRRDLGVRSGGVLVDRRKPSAGRRRGRSRPACIAGRASGGR